MQKNDISKPKVVKKKADDAAILVLHKKTGKILDANIVAKRLFKKSIKELRKEKIRIGDTVSPTANSASLEIDKLKNEISEYIELIDLSSNAMFTKDLNGKITSWNSGAQQMYGYKRDEIVGKNISLLLPVDRKNEVSEILDRIRKNEIIQNLKTKRVKKDGSVIDVILSVKAVKDVAGNIIGAATITLDISQAKIQENEMAEKIGELEKINKLMIGRELKMVELKREIVELKTKHTQVSKASDVRFQEGVELEEKIVESLDHDYMLMVMDSTLSRNKKNIIVGYLEVLLLDSRRHEKALEDLS